MTVRLFVYEYLSGGGAGTAEADAEMLAAGRAMRDALLADLVGVPGVQLSAAAADATDAEALAQHGAAAVRPGPSETPVAFVQRESAAHDLTWAIAPETDGLLLQLAGVVEPARWIGCTPVALRLCSRKRATLARLAAHGLVTPLAFDAEATRWVVKPDDGAGCLHTRRHDTLAAARAALQARRALGASATLEPWVDGEAMSLSLLCSDEGVRLLSINRQRLTIDDEGLLCDDGVAIDAPAADLQRESLRATAQAVARAIPGLHGFVGIDLVWHAQRGPVVIEVNPRVTCAYIGQSAARGCNLAGEVLAAHTARVAAQALTPRRETSDAGA